MPTNHGIDDRIATWRDRLSAAIGDGLEAGRGAELFWEERHDLGLTLPPEGPPRAVPSRHRGLALRRGDGGMLFVGEPRPDDPARLLGGETAVATGRGAAPGPPPEPTGDGPDRRAAYAAVETLREIAAAACPTAGFRARWIEFEQAVVVARTGGLVAADRRRGRRVRLDGVSGRDGHRVRAAGDAVVPPDASRAAGALEALARRVVARLQARVRAGSMIDGEYPVVLAPGVGGILVHELVGHAIEADTVLRRGSWLASLDPGTRVGIEELSILDDPRRGRAAWRVDDEGVPSRPTALVRDGRLLQPLTDRRTARRARLTLTGHGRRASFRDPVRPRMGCTFVAAGRARSADALVGIVDGLYVRRMEAAHVDASAGRAIFRVSDADRIVNGALDRPLVPFVLAIDARHALSSVDVIADDLAFDTCIGTCLRDGQAMATSVGAPTIRIPLASAAFMESA